MTRERTFSVWILVILAVLAGIIDLIHAAQYMGWLPVATFGQLNFFLPSAYWFGALLSVMVGIIWFVVAKWLYDLNPQGWVFVVVIVILNLFLLLLAWLGNSTWTTVSLGVIVNVLALILALLPNTRAAYGQG
jgi:hypothetical protein